MDRNEKSRSEKRAGFSLSQETIAILTVGVALAGLMVTLAGFMFVNMDSMRADLTRIEMALDTMRAEARADRERFDAAIAAMRVEARADRDRLDAAIDAMRTEAQAERDRFDAVIAAMRAEARADRETFTKRITRLVEQQGTLNGLVQRLRTSIASPQEEQSGP